MTGDLDPVPPPRPGRASPTDEAVGPVTEGAGAPAPECSGGVCITCSDEAVPVRVVALLGDDLALVDTGTSREEVSVALVDAVVGDAILVHAKEAIQCLGGLTDDRQA